MNSLFGREVLAMLLAKDLVRPELTAKILSWRRTGFSVHSQVRAKTNQEAVGVGKYMSRPILSLERLSFDGREGEVGYRYGQNGTKQEWMEYLKFIAECPPIVPDKSQVLIRHYGLYLMPIGARYASPRVELIIY